MTGPPSVPNDCVHVLHAAAIADALGHRARPGAVAVRAGRVLAAGSPAMVLEQAGKRVVMRDLGPRLLLPALVNAHAHLDLSDVGPRACDGDFVAWIRMVMGARPRDAAGVTHAVRRGLALSAAAGVGWVGDIAASESAVLARLAAGGPRVAGVSFIECVGFGAWGAATAGRIEARRRALQRRADEALGRGTLAIGLQPHAPYSAGAALYDVAASTPAPVCTHLAETREEDRFVRAADGPLAELLRDLGALDDAVRSTGVSPVSLLEPHLSRRPWLVAHANYVDDDDIAILSATRTAIAYCPLASDYFGHVDHPYRRLLEAGANVCLGTDSIICQPPGPDGRASLCMLTQMRHLHARDGTDPHTLLAMATVRGAAALGLEAGAATLAPGAPARFAVVSIDPGDRTDPLTQCLRSDYAVGALPAGTAGAIEVRDTECDT